MCERCGSQESAHERNHLQVGRLETKAWQISEIYVVESFRYSCLRQGALMQDSLGAVRADASTPMRILQQDFIGITYRTRRLFCRQCQMLFVSIW